MLAFKKPYPLHTKNRGNERRPKIWILKSHVPPPVSAGRFISIATVNPVSSRLRADPQVDETTQDIAIHTRPTFMKSGIVFQASAVGAATGRGRYIAPKESGIYIGHCSGSESGITGFAGKGV